MSNLEKLVKLKVQDREKLIASGIVFKEFFLLTEHEQKKVLANIKTSRYNGNTFKKES